MKGSRSAWSFDIGSVAGIRVSVHVTFLAVLIWLGVRASTSDPIRDLLLVLAIFCCVLVHELAHAAAARLFRIRTTEIVLFPVGGFAALSSHPTPLQDLLIAAAGPTVSLLLAAITVPLVNFSSIIALSSGVPPLGEGIFLANLFIFALNVLPALPLDGGRVLRAFLSMIKVEDAAAVTVKTSQIFCLALGIGALLTDQSILLGVAFLVFFGSVHEYVRAEGRDAAAAYTVAEAMIPRERLERISHGTTISKALRTALTSLQPLYPVMIGNEVMGVVFREDILEHASSEPDEYVSAIMERDIPHIEAEAPLSEAFSLFEQSGNHVMMVTRGEFVGLLLEERVVEFLLLASLRRHTSDDDTEWSIPI